MFIAQLDSILSLFIEENPQVETLQILVEGKELNIISAPTNIDDRCTSLLKWKYKGKDIIIYQAIDDIFKTISSNPPVIRNSKVDSVVSWKLNFGTPNAMIGRELLNYISKDKKEWTRIDDWNYNYVDTVHFEWTSDTLFIDSRIDSLLTVFLDSMPTLYNEGYVWSTDYIYMEKNYWRTRSTESQFRVTFMHLNKPSTYTEFEGYNPAPLFQINFKGRKIFVKSDIDRLFNSDMENTHLFVNGINQSTKEVYNKAQSYEFVDNKIKKTKERNAHVVGKPFMLTDEDLLHNWGIEWVYFEAGEQKWNRVETDGRLDGSQK